MAGLYQRHQMHITFCVLCTLLGLVACNRSAPPIKVANEPSPTTTVTPVVDDSAIIETDAQGSSDRPISDEPATEPSDSVNERESSNSELIAAAPSEVAVSDADPERVILLAETGPIVVDLIINMDGRPYRETVDVLIDDVLAAGDTDQNGQTSWKELMSNERFVFGQYGNPPIASEQQRVELEKRYDINGNNYVDRNEVLGFLRQDASNSQIFYLAESQAMSSESVTSSPIFRWLDTNSDELLDKEERVAAVKRIWKNDTEDDRIIRPADFSPSSSNNAVMRRRRTGRVPRKTLVLHEYSDWSKLLYAIEEKYAYGNPITVHDIPEFAKLFSLLDADNDEYISPQEFAEIANIPPHLTLNIQFGNDRGRRVCVKQIDSDLPLTSVAVNGDRVQVFVADSQLELAANEPNGQTSIDEQLDAVFQRFDTDKNEAISTDEFASFGTFTPVPFDIIDANNDSKLNREELTTDIQNRQMAQQSQIGGNVGANRQPLFDQLDINGDGQLTSREVNQIPTRLLMLDENGDGVVESNERPNSISIQLVRAGTPNQAPAPSPASTPSIGEQSGPRWFRSMDVNNDGEISPREFIGPIEMFAKLDSDADNFVSLSEAISNSTDEP